MNHTAENRLKLPTAVAACLMVGLLAGCTAPPAQPEPPAVDRSAQPVSLAWSSKENVVSEIQVEEQLGLAIAYVERQRKLTLVARELADGSLRWKREASVGHNPGGMRMRLPVFEHNGSRMAAFVESVKGKSERLVVIDLATGKNTSASIEVDFMANRPVECDGTWCVEGDRKSGEPVNMRYDMEKGRWKQLAGEDLPTPKENPDDRFVGEGLSSSSQRGPGEELLSYARDGKILWSVPYEQVFDSYYSTDNGWEWTTFEEPQQIFVGHGSRIDYQYHPEGDAYVQDWNKDAMMVGIDPDTGKRRWAVPGADQDCSGIVETRQAQTRSTFVTCRFHQALVTVQPSTGKRGALTGLEWDVAGIDAATGKERWAYDMPGYEKAVELAEANNRILGDQKYVIVPLASGFAAVDSSTGEKLELSHVLGDTVLCTSDRDSVEVRRIDGYEQTAYLGVPQTVQPCTRDTQKATKDLPLYAEFQRTGKDQQRIAVLPERTGMVAYRMPEE